jgi:transposase
MRWSLTLGTIEVLGVERRRRWPDEVKLAILSEVNTNGWTLADVARRHDVTRQHLYQWRRELRGKGRIGGDDGSVIMPVELVGPADPALASNISTDISVHLRNGRLLRCREAIADHVLVRLVRALEAA